MARIPSRKRKAPRLPRATLAQRLRNDFLTGLVVVLPVFLTFYIVSAVVNFADRNVVPLVPARYRPETFENLFGIGLVIFLVVTTAVGAFTKGIVGRQIVQFGERLVDRTPVIRSIYNAVKQLVENVFSPSGASFKQVCLVEYPRRGIWALGFLSNEARGEIQNRFSDQNLVAIFIPSTPNPTTGYLMYFPRGEVTMLDMSVEDAAKLVITGGLVTPPSKPDYAPDPEPAAPVRQPGTVAAQPRLAR